MGGGERFTTMSVQWSLSKADAIGTYKNFRYREVVLTVLWSGVYYTHYVGYI